MSFLRKLLGTRTRSSTERCESCTKCECQSEEFIGILPDEILALVLSFLPPNDIGRCSLVCKLWRDIISLDVWRLKCLRNKDIFAPSCLILDSGEDWRNLCIKNPYGRNLVKNYCAKEGKDHWVVTHDGGHGFAIECDNLLLKAPGVRDEYSLIMPSEGTGYCWATSFQKCTKYQIIDLIAEGFSIDTLDRLRPPIYISEWTAARYDCASTYRLKVELLSADTGGGIRKRGEPIDRFTYERRVEQWLGGHWHKVEHWFTGYKPGVRRIYFKHSGVDGQFWAGHYGPKFTMATVKCDFSFDLNEHVRSLCETGNSHSFKDDSSEEFSDHSDYSNDYSD